MLALPASSATRSDSARLPDLSTLITHLPAHTPTPSRPGSTNALYGINPSSNPRRSLQTCTPGGALCCVACGPPASLSTCSSLRREDCVRARFLLFSRCLDTPAMLAAALFVLRGPARKARESAEYRKGDLHDISPTLRAEIAVAVRKSITDDDGELIRPASRGPG